MNAEELLNSGAVGAIGAGLVALIGKWLDKRKADREIRSAEVADYQGQIDHLQEQVRQLHDDVAKLRKELRQASKREYRLLQIIHQHCHQNPHCSPWFDAEMAKLGE